MYICLMQLFSLVSKQLSTSPSPFLRLSLKIYTRQKSELLFLIEILVCTIIILRCPFMFYLLYTGFTSGINNNLF